MVVSWLKKARKRIIRTIQIIRLTKPRVKVTKTPIFLGRGRFNDPTIRSGIKMTVEYLTLMTEIDRQGIYIPIRSEEKCSDQVTMLVGPEAYS